MIYGCLSAFAGVYNQNLNQSSSASLHANNMVLFFTGSCINLAIHLTLSWWNPERPGILDGLNDPAAVVLVLSSAFIGLATTTVYKCTPSLC
jgi:Nucleotide-sugar transporter